MTNRRFILLALLVGLLAFLAAGCGGDDDEAADTGGATTEEGGGEAVSGNISVLAVWTGAEGEAFQAVLDGFKEENPDVTVSYKSASEPATVLSTAVEGGNPPDIAALPQPGFMTDFAERGALKPIEFARERDRGGLLRVVARPRRGRRRALRPLLQGRQQVDGLVQRRRLRGRGRRATGRLGRFLEAGDTLKSSGVTPYSIGAADGWTLTDLFENIYLRTAGPEKYDQLTKHEIPWTDQSVKDALTEMAKVVASDNVAGGTSSALQTDFPTSVTQVFADPPKAAQVLEGDFVGGVIAAETKAEPETGFNVYAFPEIGDSGAGGGRRRRRDGHVQGQPGRAGADRVPRHAGGGGDLGREGRLLLAEQERRHGGLPGRVTKQTAKELANAEVFRFDMSDLMPGAFGSDSLFTLLQDFVQNPDDVDGIATKLEAAAKTAFKSVGATESHA